MFRNTKIYKKVMFENTKSIIKIVFLNTNYIILYGNFAKSHFFHFFAISNI